MIEIIYYTFTKLILLVAIIILEFMILIRKKMFIFYNYKKIGTISEINIRFSYPFIVFMLVDELNNGFISVLNSKTNDNKFILKYPQKSSVPYSKTYITITCCYILSNIIDGNIFINDCRSNTIFQYNLYIYG